MKNLIKTYYVLILFVVILQPSIVTANKFAILIGVPNAAHYSGDSIDFRDSKKRFAIADVEQMRKKLLFLGFSPSNIKILNGTFSNGEYTTESKLSIKGSIVDWLAPLENQNDTILFYYSGVCASVEENSVFNLDGDIDPRGVDGFLYVSSLRYVNNVSDGELAGWLNQLESTRQIVIIDAPYAAQFLWDLSKNNRIVCVSSGYNEGNNNYYQESWSFKQSIFSYYYIEALFGLADNNKDFKISAEEAFNYAFTKTTSFHTGQNPMITDGITGDQLLTPFDIYGAIIPVSSYALDRRDGIVFLNMPMEDMGARKYLSDVYWSIFNFNYKYAYNTTPAVDIKTNGFSYANPNDCSFHGFIPAGYPTITGCQVKSVLYYVICDLEPNYYYRWVPVSPTDLRLVYSVCGSIKDANVKIENVLLDANSINTVGQISIDGIYYNSPYSFSTHVGQNHNIAANSTIIYNGEIYYFDYWSDGGAQTHDVYITTNTSTTAPKSSYDAVFTAYYKKIPPITIQNKIWDFGVTNCGTVVVDGVSYPSLHTVKWVPGTTHTIGASGYVIYNSRAYYYISWADDPNRTRTIVAPNISAVYSACYKLKPVLTGTYDAYTYKSYLSISGWDNRPPNSNFWPQHYEDVAGRMQFINLFGSSYPYPNTSCTYQHLITFTNDDNVFVWNVNSAIYSNILAIQKGIVGDPIVASSNTEEATAFSNGKKLGIDSNGKLHVVFASNDSVCYATSTDDGETWTIPSSVGEGKNPAIELSANQTASVCWSKGNQLYYTDNPNNTSWAAPKVIYTGPEGTEVTYLSYVLDQKTNQSYMGWVDNGPTGATAYVSPYNSSSSGSLAPAPIGSGATDAFKSPSLALDKKGNLKVVWSQNAKLYYYDENGQVELGEGGIHPIVDTYGEKTTVVWQEETEPGKYRVVRKVKTPEGWGDNQAISWADSGDAKSPAAVAAGQYAFTKENGNGDYDIYYLGEYENGNYITTQNISGASGGQSYYPSIAFRQSWPKHKLYFLWTEKAAKGSKSTAHVKLVAKDLMPVPSWGVYPNVDFASCYTTQREGAFNYGAVQYAIVDYHPDKLKYHFEGLDPYKRYKAKVVYYRNIGDKVDNPSSDWLEKLKVDNVSLKLSHVPDTTIVSEEALIPRNCYKDGIIDVTIEKIKGDYAICAMLEIYEYEGDGKSQGGSQSEEISSIEQTYTNKLYQNCPNPFNNKTTFVYQLKNQELVSLKIYNALGQLVKTLVNETKSAGVHESDWNGRDGNGLKVSTGVYLYKLQTGDYIGTKKMVILH